MNPRTTLAAPCSDSILFRMRPQHKAPSCSSTISTSAKAARSMSQSTPRCSKKDAGFLAGKGSDTEKVHELIQGVAGIYVKSFEFSVPDAYSESDVDSHLQKVSDLNAYVQ